MLYASQVFVESYQSSDKLPAQVEAVSPGIDLAVIRLDDESFFDKRSPVVRTEALPEVKDTVLVYGYPQGGSTLSVTKGIVSRIEFAGYGEGTSGVRVQVDAAINPGNSGGPAICGREDGGVDFQQADAGGQYWLHHTQRGDRPVSQGRGRWDVRRQARAARIAADARERRAAGFSETGQEDAGDGRSFDDPSDPQDPLKPFDLLTKIAEHDIDNVGMVKIKDNLRLNFHYLIQKVAKGNKVPLTVVRDGKTLSIDVPAKNHYPMLISSLKGKYPSYFIYGPLVFSPVTNEFVSAFDRTGRLYGAAWP